MAGKSVKINSRSGYCNLVLESSSKTIYLSVILLSIKKKMYLDRYRRVTFL